MSLYKVKRYFFLVPLLFFSVLYGEIVYGGNEEVDRINVTSHTMEVESDKKLVVFKGDVVAEEDFILCSDRLYVQYTGKDEIKQMIAEGSVRIVQGNRGARGNRAVYDRENRIVIITGSAEALECGDMVRGDRITLYLDTEDVLVESKSGGRVSATILPEKKECEEVSIGEVLRCP